MKKSEIKLNRLVFVLSMIATLAVAIGGYLHYSTLKESTIEREHRQESEHLKDMRDRIDSYLAWSLISVKALAGIKELQHLLVNGDASALAEANAILDHFNDTVQASVCYLMDRSGNTIASSNRDTPVSFVGKNYAFRPYFQQAMQGFPAIYMALGVTSKKRGIYFSHPVYGKGKESPLGVAIIKTSVEMIPKDFMKPHDGIVLLTDPHGVVFASDRKEWLYHVLWEVSSDKISEIAKTRQFGKGPWDWTGVKRVGKDDAVDNLGNEYHVHREELAHYQGWHLVSLHDHLLVSKRVTESLLGTVGFSTLVLCVLIGLFILFLYKKTSSEITQRERAEEELRESEGNYRTIFENIQDVYYESSLDGVILEVSPSIDRISQYKRDELIGKSLYDIYTNPDERDEFIKVILAKGRVNDFEVNLTDKDGSQAPCSISTLLVADEQGNPLKLVGSMRDLKERKQAEQEKRKLETKLQQAQKLEAIGILAGGLAHDFNNLLAIIVGNIDLAKDDIKSEVGISENLIEAEKASLRAKELTKQLITFSKGGEPVKEVGSIGDLVKDTTNLTISGSNARCEFSLPENLWLAEFDEGQMKHVIKNLIDNTLESMPDCGSIDIQAENFEIDSETAESISPFSEGKYIKISIRDHGVGIPEEHLSKIFDPYFSTKEMGVQKGMGMGLATTYSIINRHDGHITVESEVGIGTTFTLYLPAHEKDFRKLKPVEKLKPEKPAVLTGRILLMDDEKMIRNLSRQMLSRLGYEPETAKDGVEAIELYKKAKDTGKLFDAVILDLTIKGGMGGKDTVKALMEIDPQVKAIVSSGYSNDLVMTNFRAYGFIGALPKPYPTKDLKDILSKIIMK